MSEIARGDGIPHPVLLAMPEGFRGVDEFPVDVPEEVTGIHSADDDEVGLSVAVKVGEERGRSQADIRSPGAILVRTSVNLTCPLRESLRKRKLLTGFGYFPGCTRPDTKQVHLPIVVEVKTSYAELAGMVAGQGIGVRGKVAVPVVQ